MTPSRDSVLTVRRAIDDWLPPKLRDKRWLIAPVMRLVLGEAASDVLSFKDRVYSMTEGEIRDLYARVSVKKVFQQKTDLNESCLNRILEGVSGPTVLEVGCGRGHLAGLMSSRWHVAACDIVIPSSVKDRLEDVYLCEASAESLPFRDGSFDTVVCTHTLEHVRDLRLAIDELRRVARSQIIVVVPRERPYRYGFNLHLHFFPERWSLEAAFNTSNRNASLTEYGDWMYVELLG